MTSDTNYWAFISYSHVDTKLAEWLHRSLESYKIPKSLSGKTINGLVIPKRLFPIFRDRDELPGAHDLGGKLKQSLTNSRYLVILCSKSSSKSKWVDEEIRFFQNLGRYDRILCILINGDPSDSGENGCIPPSIKLNQDGERSIDPLAVDLRPGKDLKSDALLRLIAGLLGLGFDDLKMRESQKRRKSRRILACMSVGCAFLAFGIYVAVVDAGYNLPGGARGRDYIDRFQLSVLRPVESMDKIERVAKSNSKAIFDRLYSEMNEGKWIKSYTNHPNGVRNGLDVWVAGQSLSGMLNSPDQQLEVWRDATAKIDLAFSDGLPIEVDGLPYGWQVTHTNCTQAEPALWLVVAIAKAHRSSYANDESRKRLESLLSYAQAAAIKYYGDNGDWYMVSGKIRPKIASNYTATLALLAILETNSANLPWEGSHERLKELLKSTSSWLMSQFDAHAKQPGWHCNPTAMHGWGTHDGLSLQAFFVLMRAQEEGGEVLSSQIKVLIPNYLLNLEERNYEYPCDIYRPTYEYTDFLGVSRTESPTIKFLWYPWAVACGTYWLKSSLAKEALPEIVVRMRRVLAHLVVGLSSDIDSKVVQSKKSSYIAAETLYGLSSVWILDRSSVK